MGDIVNRTTLQVRYEGDPAFHRAVKFLFSLMSETTELTPLDIRDACYLARMHFEMTNVRPILISRSDSMAYDSFIASMKNVQEKL